jgi:hypothetical protein
MIGGEKGKELMFEALSPITVGGLSVRECGPSDHDWRRERKRAHV